MDANLEIDARTFPGWQVSPTFAPELRVQQERTLATLQSVIDAASVTVQQLPMSNSRLTAMKAQFGSITSAQPALDFNGSVAIHAAEERTLLRQQLAAQATGEAVVPSPTSSGPRSTERGLWSQRGRGRRLRTGGNVVRVGPIIASAVGPEQQDGKQQYAVALALALFV